ncbi:MAG: ATP-binding protein [Dehalococcoidales bacterium]|nr:ATP-binding protein [Dehalococcoidales bacterium]
MSRSIYWKLTIPLTALVLLTMGFLGFYMINTTRDIQINNLESQLVNEAKLVANISIPGFSNVAQNENLDTIAKSIGTQIGTRITFISIDGTVLGDTDQAPAGMENHAGRPEVIAALATGVGQATRYSATLHENMMYVAVPVTGQGKVLGIARLALPLKVIESSVNTTVMTIVWAVAAATLLVILASVVVTRLITRPVRQITGAAEGIAAGKLDQQIPVKTTDEIGRLGRAFNEMSANIKKNIAVISDERSRLAAVMSRLTDGVVVTDAEGKIILANPATERLFNFREKDAITRPLIEAVRDHEADEILKLCLKTGQTQSVQFETAVTRRFLRAIAVPIKEGKQTGVLLLFQDLTELRSLHTMRRELVGNISHELRTPLAGIKAMVETLKDGAINDKVVATDFLARINNEIDRLTQMVSELTQLSRIETGKADLKRTPVDINLLIEEVVAQLNPLAEKQQVTIAVELASPFPPVIADSDRIRQTVINLMHNAIKFNHAGGKVAVSIRADRQAVTVSVSDTGIGIAKDDLPHVFERFYKADKARTSGGSGLGLAIAKHTVQAHNGNIWAESEEGKGSTFSFSIPLKANPGPTNL